MQNVYLLLGSNLGDSKKYISDSVDIIQKRIGIIIQKSSLYQTESWGNTDQPDFINQVILINSELSPEEVLKEILSIETELGRRRHEKWGSRIIDIDILFYGDQVVKTDDLTVPHPFLHLRKFTLMPLCEISPELIHPTLNKSASELLRDLDDELSVKKLT